MYCSYTIEQIGSSVDFLLKPPQERKEKELQKKERNSLSTSVIQRLHIKSIIWKVVTILHYLHYACYKSKNFISEDNYFIINHMIQT